MPALIIVAFMFKHQHCLNAEREAPLLLNLFNEQKYSEDMARETAKIVNKILKEV